jgi:hypothetical protein
MFYIFEDLLKALKTRGRILRSASDLTTWARDDSLQERWGWRTEIMASLLPVTDSVLELGAGNCLLERLLPDSTSYTPADIVSRRPGMIKVDLNQPSMVRLPSSTTVVFCGLAEYIFNLEALLRRVILETGCREIVFTYCTTDDAPSIIYRRRLGWVNDYSEAEILSVLRPLGRVSVLHREQKNRFFRLDTRRSSAAEAQDIPQGKLRLESD